MRTARVGPFRVIDINARDLPALLVRAAVSNGRTIAFALHVGGLNRSRDSKFVHDMNAADVTYADGAAVVLVARIAGASAISRAATTDIGVPTILELARVLDRAPRIALVGGKAAVAARVGKMLEQMTGCKSVFAADGYTHPLGHHANALVEAKPDLVFVGLGMPLEARAVMEARDRLPACLIMTCGGWFGFLVGHERRAPGPVQRLGMEWLWRLGQSPSRLLGRYALGAAVTVKLAVGAARSRPQED